MTTGEIITLRRRRSLLRKLSASLAVAAATLAAGAPVASAAFGDGFGIADADGAALPGPHSFWAGTCQTGTAPPLGAPIPGGVGSRQDPIWILPSTAGSFINPGPVAGDGVTPAPPPATRPAPATAGHCIDIGTPAQGLPAWVDDPQGGVVERAPSWRLAPAAEAGVHPDGSATFTFAREPGSIGINGAPDNIVVDLPAGFVGDPTAVPKCSADQFATATSECPPESQVGIVNIFLRNPVNGGQNGLLYPVYNLEPRPGRTAEFGIPDVTGATSARIVAKARTNGDFGVTTFVPQIPGALDLYTQTVTIWGVPWAASHDIWRVRQGIFRSNVQDPALPVSGLAPADQAVYDPSWGPIRPFISNPTECSGQQLSTRLATDSYQNPGPFTSDGDPDLPPFPGVPAPGSSPWVAMTSPAPAVTDCDALAFDPDFSLSTSTRADSATGLEVELSIPQNDDPPQAIPGNPDLARDPDDANGAPAYWRSNAGRAVSHLKDTVVELPEGMSINPSAANGMGVCTSHQIGLTSPIGQRPITFNDDDPSDGRGRECPESAKIAEVVVETPLLDRSDWPTGQVYLAAQEDNPFNSDFAIYIVLRSVERGLVIKLAGEVKTDPETGKLTTTVADNPQLPFDRFSLKFKPGSRAPLATPPVCGTGTLRTTLVPYAGADKTVTISDPYTVNSSPAGGCPGSPGARPFDPGFSAGSANPIAGAHTPFTVRLTRPDGEQELDRVEVTTPEGFAARLKGVPYCPESGIAHAAARTATGDGAEEQANPSCPAQSQIGTTTIGAGAGDSPFYVDGKVYLAGPYNGAPVSLAFVVPAVAGPFDLGVQVVRAAVNVNPKTAQLTTVSDEIPKILRGVPLRIRDIRVEIDKPSFAVNPTDCSAQLVTGKVSGASGATSDVSNRFQVGACRDLAFGPRMKLRLFGGIKRAKYQGLRAVVRPKPGEANISRTVVRMPTSAFLAQEHLKNICTRVQWAADACPKNSIYGRAIAYSPLLDFPLRGNVHLRSSDNLLPDLVADLRGPAHQPIRIELVGRTDSVKGALRNTFDVVPDAPVSYFRLQLFGGNKGLIVNSRNICRGKNRAGVRFDAQNGRRQILRPVLFNRRCAVLAKKRRAQRRKAKRSAHRKAKRTRRQRANR